MDERAMPECASEIGPAWLTDVLRSCGGLPSGRVARCEAARLGTQGMTSETYRLALGYDGDAGASAPHTLIAKLASSDPTTRAMMHAFGAYARELRFYAELARATELRTPHCYFAAQEPESGAFVLLLEEVRGVPGVPTLEALEQALCDIAKLHARFWNAPELDQFEWLEYAPEIVAAFEHQLRGIGERITARIGAELPPVFDATLSLSAAHYMSLYADERRRHRTVIHGDLHPGQIITAAAGPVVFDWQTATIGSPGRDLARVIAMSLSPALRRQHEARLLDLYHRALLRCGVRGYSRRDCFDDYRRGLVASTLINAFAIADLDQAKLNAPVAAGEPAILELMIDYLDCALEDTAALRLLRSDIGLQSAAA